MQIHAALQQQRGYLHEHVTWRMFWFLKRLVKFLLCSLARASGRADGTILTINKLRHMTCFHARRCLHDVALILLTI